MNIFKLLDKAVESFTTKTLVVCVLSMLLLSVLNIVLRWFNAHVMWIEPFVRYMVVLSAFLGGVIATGRGTHIGIDIIGKYFETKKMMTAHAWVKRIIDVVSIVALIFLTKACVDFVSQEAEYGRIVFLGIHAKYLAMILPFGFGLMGIRFFLGLVLSFDHSEKEQA
jgi:TRAP-type C4-dicarboxylate transport system permease small subunit